MLSRMTGIGLKMVEPAQVWYLRTSIATFARAARERKRGSTRSHIRKGSPNTVMAKSLATESDPALAWTPVTDPACVYWRNTVTNETTSVGAPKPLGPTLATSSNYVAAASTNQDTFLVVLPHLIFWWWLFAG